MSRIKKNIKKRFSVLINQLKLYEVTKSADALHEIRTELKKIQILIYLIEWDSNKFESKKEFQSLLRLFKKAGQIRKLDIIEQLALKYAVPKNMIIGIGQKKERLKSLFVKRIPEYKKVVKNCYNYIPQRSQPLKTSDLEKVRFELETKLSSQMFSSPDNLEFHSIRKSIKQFLYIDKLLNKNWGEQRSAYYLLQDKIGEWRDKCTLLEFMKNHPVKYGEITRKLRIECMNDSISIITMFIDTYKNSR